MLFFRYKNPTFSIKLFYEKLKKIDESESWNQVKNEFSLVFNLIYYFWIFTDWTRKLINKLIIKKPEISFKF